MKVICIDGKHNIKTTGFDLPEGIVLDAYECKYPECYRIDGYDVTSNGKPLVWGKRRFVPLSNIDEMELLEQREELLQSL